MKPLEINNYILRYIKVNRTHSAIMLTGGWGTGKSYYIQNTLIPFLKENSIKCVTLSLYGLNTLSEVSKNLYWEIRAQFLPNSEAFMTGKTIAKTILRGAASALNIDIFPTDEDLKKLYDSVNLSEKLIVLEDIERCQIPIFDILGYVNSLVDQDNVKILLVSNEDEFIKRNSIKTNDDSYSTLNSEYTTSTNKYLSIKEKTISDTIQWTGNSQDSIPAIIKSFDNEFLSIFATKDLLQELLQFLNHLTGTNHYSSTLNLRTFIFACQKTLDVISFLSDSTSQHVPEVEFKYLKSIFFSITAFSYQIKNGVIPSWDGTKYLSFSLSSYDYPLYRFCYDYIKEHLFDIKTVAPALEAHDSFCIFDERSRTPDSDISILEDFFLYPESVVLNALSNLNNRLSTKNAVPFFYYGKLPSFLIQLHTILEYNYQEIKEKMIRNCAGISGKIDVDLLFLTHNEFKNPDEVKQYNEFKSELIESINSNHLIAPKFDYNPDNLSLFLNKIVSSAALIQENHAFISQYDVQKLVNMLINCSAEHIFTFRSILFSVYRYATPDLYIQADLETLNSLLDQINFALNSEAFSSDKIIKFQISLLCNNIKTLISQLSS